MSMTFGFIGGKKPEQTEAMARLARECGYASLEFDYWRDFENLTDDAVAAQAKVLKANGIGVCAYGLWGYNHISADADERKHCHKMLDRGIKYAAKLGAKVMVLSTGDIKGEPLGRKIQIFAETFAPFFRKIASAGMSAAFYALHGGTFLYDLPAYERTWETLPDLKMKYDAANWLGAGKDWLDVLRRYGHKVGHVHIKEAVFVDGRVVSQPPAGMGDMPWGKIMTFLHEHRYQGCLCVEPHMEPWKSGEGLKANLLLSRRHLEQFMF